MSYTPSTSFSFGGSGYIPSASFAFGVYVDFRVGQRWTLAAHTFSSTLLQQQWTLIASASSVGLGQSWVLNAPAFSGLALGQSWALSVPGFADARVRQHWALATPAFSSRPANQIWGLSAPVFDALQAGQRWSLFIPESHPARFLQQWVLQATAIWTPVITAIHYTLTLTGAEDSTTDAVLPMSSFQSRLRSGNPSYLQAVVPYTAALADAVSARPHGQLIVRRGRRWTDGTVQVEEIARASLELISSAQGGRSQSITLSGHRTHTYSAPKSVALADASYRAVSNGRRRYRCAIENSLLPGDTAIVGADSFVVAELQHLVDTRTAIMEVSEADG